MRAAEHIVLHMANVIGMDGNDIADLRQWVHSHLAASPKWSGPTHGFYYWYVNLTLLMTAGLTAFISMVIGVAIAMLVKMLDRV